MDAAGAAKLGALYVLAITDVPLTTSSWRVDPWWGSSLALTISADTGQRAGAGWVAPSEVRSPRWRRQRNICVGH